jgi:osmotically-inducible protein OsmY
MTDADIRRNVESELNWEPAVASAAAIGVAVKNGVASLSGQVPNYVEKWAAQRAAERVSGVAAVVNDLDVHLASDFRRTDEDIAGAAVIALRWNLSVPADRLKLEVKDGWITLDGEVDWQYQRDAAETAVRYLAGVKGVTNLIGIKAAASRAVVRSDIDAALKRNAQLEARQIGINVDGQTVTLTGTVRSYAERDEASRAAWSAPGVYSVDNQIAVSP